MQVNFPTFYVNSSWIHQHFSWHLQMRNIAIVYVWIWYIYNLSVELIKCGSNTQHNISPFHKKNIALRLKKFQGILPTLMFAYLVIIYIFGACGIYGRYIQHYMLDFLIFNLTITWWNCQNLCYHYWVSFSGHWYSSLQGGNPTLYVRSSWFQLLFNCHLKMRKFSKIYARMWCIYITHTFKWVKVEVIANVNVSI